MPTIREWADTDLTGQRFGRLTVARMITCGGRMWSCNCDCGITVEAPRRHLLAGRVVSCGCYLRDHPGRLRHGSARKGNKTAEYRCWIGMRQRCENARMPCFKNYGGRGIRVCARWQSFEHFLADMQQRPSRRHTIERKNVDGDYEPSNCIWATRADQNDNRRDTIRIRVGHELLTIKQLARQAGLPHATLYARLRRYGWTLQRALATPVDGCGGVPCRT